MAMSKGGTVDLNGASQEITLPVRVTKLLKCGIKAEVCFDGVVSAQSKHLNGGILKPIGAWVVGIGETC